MRARPSIAALSMIALAMIVSVLAAPEARSAPAARSTAASTAAGPANRTLYVSAASPRCSDAGTGSRTVPFCSIQAAANVATSGQTVDIEQSARRRLPFTQPVMFTRSGTPAEPIVFKGISAGSAGLPDIKSKPGVTPVTFRDVHDVTIESLGITYGGNADGVDVKGSSNITLTSVTLASSGPAAEKLAAEKLAAGKLAAGEPAAGEPAPVRIDGQSSAVTLSRVAFDAGTIWGHQGAGASESFRLGGRPAMSPVIGPVQRQESIRPASASRAMGPTIPPFGIVIFSPPTGAWCQPVHCWGAPFTYTVDWGDGTPAIPVTPDVWISHSYKSTGIYLVTVTAKGSDGTQQSGFTMAYAW
jgi:PKD domain